MKVSDEVIRAMVKAFYHPTLSTLEAARAAADVLVPVVLAEALKEPSKVEIFAAAQPAQPALHWKYSSEDYARGRIIFDNWLRAILANRLRALLAPPVDPAVEAVFDTALKATEGDGLLREVKLSRSSCEKIVAAVRAADKGAA